MKSIKCRLIADHTPILMKWNEFKFWPFCPFRWNQSNAGFTMGNVQNIHLIDIVIKDEMVKTCTWLILLKRMKWSIKLHLIVFIENRQNGLNMHLIDLIVRTRRNSQLLHLFDFIETDEIVKTSAFDWHFIETD